MKISPWRFTAYILLLAGSVVLASLQGGTIPYMCLFTVLLYLPVSLLWTAAGRGFLSVYQETANLRFMKEEEQPWKLILENDGPVRINDLRLGFDKARSATVTDDASKCSRIWSEVPGERITIEGKVTALYAGSYSVGLTDITLSDPFGIFLMKFPVPSPLRVTVMPRITSVADSVLNFENLKNSTRMKSPWLKEPVPGNDIRFYRRGDPLRSIHWKASAAAGELMTRVPDNLEVHRIILILIADPDRSENKSIEAIKRRDYFLEFAVSAAWYHADKAEPLLIIYPRGSIKHAMVITPEDFSDFYEDISRGPFYNKESDITELAGYADRAGADEQGNIIIILREREYPSERFLEIRS